MADQPGAVVDVAASAEDKGLQAGGTVHHVAFRAPDGETQERWRQHLVEAGLNVTPILDRPYFTSIYFREPGGVLFEIATDRPGFDVDEPLLELGRHLKLPPWLEPDREQIERSLPPLRVPDVA
jgi:glyoxalase family protein